MNLVEKLLRIDKEKTREKETKTIKSKKLSKLMGEDTQITIQELSGRRMNVLTQMIMDKNGDKDFSRMNDMNLMYCVYGVIDPPLNDKTLMEHFGASTPKDLAEILFGVEAGKIAGEIAKLSGMSDDAEDEVKN